MWRSNQFLANDHLLRVSREQRLSPMIRMIPGAVHRSPDIYLTAEENTGKVSCATSHRIRWDPLPSYEVGRIAQHVRKGEWTERRRGTG